MLTTTELLNAASILWLPVLFGLLIGLIFGSVSSWQRPVKLDHTFTVLPCEHCAGVKWLPTGIDVYQGRSWFIRVVNASGCYPPNGNSRSNVAGVLQPIQTCKEGELVAKVGSYGSVFSVDTSFGSFQRNETGELQMAFQGLEKECCAHGGKFTVTVMWEIPWWKAMLSLPGFRKVLANYVV